jgi:hypothetical protein
MEGGISITDVDALDNRSKHPINMIQRYCVEQMGCNCVIQQKYDKITKKEDVTRKAQITINNLCDFTKKTIMGKQFRQLHRGFKCN